MLALVFMLATIDVLRDEAGSEGTRKDLKYWFGSLPAAILSLFKSMSGGLEWEKVGDALMSISLFYGILFAVFVGFVLFGVMNVVVGVFVESARATAKKVEIEEKLAYVEDVKRVLFDMDKHKQGSISKAVF